MDPPSKKMPATGGPRSMRHRLSTHATLSALVLVDSSVLGKTAEAAISVVIDAGSHHLEAATWCGSQGALYLGTWQTA
jgi:hypothetical protein